jgi:hypothetical protein
MRSGRSQVTASAQARRRTHSPSWADQAVFLGDRDEFQRRDHAAHRMVPAHQGLEAADLAVGRPASGW